MQPVLHPRTKTKLEHYLKKPAHGLLLSGPEGSGKLHVAAWLASELGAEHVIIEPAEGKSGISIEQIRELYNLTRTGSLLAVIIKEGQSLSREAQNAFLKLLEEPPKNTYFIITVDQAEALLPTIRSRSQHIVVLPPPKNALMQATLAGNLTEAQQKSLLHTTEGLAGRYFTLAKDTVAYKSHQAALAEAKQFYTAEPYQRHLVCIQHAYGKPWAEELLQLLAIIIHSLLKQAGSTAAKTKLIAQSELLEATAHNVLAINGNPKIHLAKLCHRL